MHVCINNLPHICRFAARLPVEKTALCKLQKSVAFAYSNGHLSVIPRELKYDTDYWVSTERSLRSWMTFVSQHSPTHGPLTSSWWSTPHFSQDMEEQDTLCRTAGSRIGGRFRNAYILFSSWKSLILAHGNCRKTSLPFCRQAVV